MEHGASERVKEQSHTAMSVKAEMDKAAPSATCRGVQTNVNFTEEEPGLAELVKSEPALVVKEEVVEDGSQDIAELQCGPSTSAIVGSTNVFDSVADPGNTLNIKEELGSIDIGPTVLQLMDAQGTNNQPDVSIIKQESRIKHNNMNAVLCGGVTEATIEGERRADTDDQRSKEAAQSEQQARFQLYSCDKCAKTYAFNESLLEHYRNRHSTESHKCTKCNKIFPSKLYLYNHTIDAHSEQQYECAVCKKICRSKTALNQHVYQVHRPRPAADTDDQRSKEAAQSEQQARFQLYSCDKCAKTYAFNESLLEHYRNRHSTESHKCTKCNKNFPSKLYLYNHTIDAHSEQQYECAVCKKICRSKTALNQHVYQVHRPRPAAMDKQRCLHATSTPAITTGMHVATGVVVQDDGLNIKEECADTDLDIGPTVLQPMDATYRPAQSDVSIIKQESSMNAILCGGVKEEIIEDDRRADMDTQRGKEASQSEQRARSQLYSCDKCEKTYACKNTLKTHYRNLHSTESHKCTKCKKKIPSKAYLYYHTRNAHSEQQYECAVCKKIYKSKLALTYHVNQIHRPRPAVSSPVVRTCDHCHKTYINKQGLIRHIDVVHTKVLYRCSECNAEFKGKHLLQGHMTRVHLKEKHESSKPRIYTCDYCKKMFTDKGDIRSHILVVHSSGSYKCDQCNKIFKCNAYLMSHKTAVHNAGSQPRMHICDYCKKTCTTKYGLMIHITIMHAGGSYKCSQCNRCFKCEQYLMLHTRRIHPAVSSPVVYTCDYCHKIYAKKQSLVNHIEVVHTKVRYRCSECNKEYTGKLSLQAHIRRVHSKEKHEGLQIHTCEYCQKTFHTRTGLWQHTKSIHVAAHIHRCRRCNKNFKSSNMLQRHNTSIHGKPHKCQICLKFYNTIYNLGRHFKKAHNSKDIQFKSDLCPHETPDSRLTADVTNAAASTSAQQHNVDVVKEEPADGELELGPVVFQHMDCNYRPYEEEPQDGLGD